MLASATNDYCTVMTTYLEMTVESTAQSVLSQYEEWYYLFGRP